MATKKYPVGTKIKFIGHDGMANRAKSDIGKCGIIVAIPNDRVDEVIILLKKSEKPSFTYHGKEATWKTLWVGIVPIAIKNQQLLFDFAYEE